MTKFVPLAEINVEDYDRIRNDQIGHVTIDVKECFLNPDVYQFNKVLPLQGPPNLIGKYRSFGSVYLQAKFLREGSPDQDNFANMLVNMDEYLRQFQIKGKIIVHAVHAKHLLKDDGLPDPFLQFTFPSKKELTTRKIKNSVYPVWKEIVSSSIHMSRKEANFVDVEVIDSNLTFNTKLGKFVIDMEPCYAAPNTWAVNRVFLVEPPKDKESKVEIKKTKRRSESAALCTCRRSSCQTAPRRTLLNWLDQ